MCAEVLTTLSPELSLIRQRTNFSARNALAQEALREESAAPATDTLLPEVRSPRGLFGRGSDGSRGSALPRWGSPSA